MPISPDEFATYYPRLYHMAEADVWPSIRKHGLLSTTALLDLFEVNGDLRFSLESAHRPESISITHRDHGSAVIRDQKPMREGPLAGCLRGMTRRQWYELLNGQVFFWVTADRVNTLLNARAYRNRKHTVITMDTASVVARYADRIVLSPINSGSTIYNPRERGPETFRPFETYPFAERRRLRGLGNAVAELAVKYGVPDLPDFAIRVEHRKGDRTLEVLFHR
jgi:hypothetical protein